jgi:hypothetical protein
MTAVLHINRPSSTRYRARVRMSGCRKWRLLPGEHKRLDRAAAQLARVFSEGRYKRGEVLLTADYYDPRILIEMVRR